MNPAIRRLFERFSPRGFEVVYLGAFETPESCKKWQEDFDLPFPVVNDADGELFQQLTTGWVPCSMLVGPDGKILFWESEFDEAGFTSAIERLYAVPPEPEAAPAVEKPTRRAGASETATIVVLGGGAGGLVAATNCVDDFRRNTAS